MVMPIKLFYGDKTKFDQVYWQWSPFVTFSSIQKRVRGFIAAENGCFSDSATFILVAIGVDHLFLAAIIFYEYYHRFSCYLSRKVMKKASHGQLE